MKLESIPFNRLLVKIHDLWENQWFLLTSGDFEKGHFNTMTVAWGSLGVMWGKPFAQVVVRPTRYTFEFMEKYPSFTLCAFPVEYRNALDLMGSRSGRNTDKIAASGLLHKASTKIAAPCYEEAELILECRKMYWDDFKPTHFLDSTIENNYPQKDYHRIYFGEILAILGTDKYQV